MKKILIRTCAFSFLAASMLASCSSDNTTGVDTEGTENNTTESQPNMGGKTGNSAELDSVATDNNDNPPTQTGTGNEGTGNNGN